ncbi:MAG: hypothetical protein M1820_003174 [Bogoriella megaspora]|nr:MAG: hypothetical protein M1820_003174 [Bogoriella megaspora]
MKDLILLTKPFLLIVIDGLQWLAHPSTETYLRSFVSTMNTRRFDRNLAQPPITEEAILKLLFRSVGNCGPLLEDLLAKEIITIKQVSSRMTPGKARRGRPSLPSLVGESSQDDGFYALISYSLRAGITKEPDDLQHQPSFQAIIHGIKFSRRFIISYQVVLVGALLLISTIHWSKEFRRARRRNKPGIRAWKSENEVSKKSSVEVTVQERECEREGSSSSSSTSSAPQGYAKYPAEQTPLLAGEKRQKSSNQGPFSRIRAFFLYQPKPIPYVNIYLPSNGTTTFILAFFILNIFYTLYCLPWTLPAIFLIGDRAALVFVANLPWLYLLSAKNAPIKYLTGYSYEALNVFHRRLGELLCLEAVIHAVAMFLAYLGLTISSDRFTWTAFLSSRLVILGLLAFISYQTLYFASLSSLRQRWYETFLAIHVTLQFAALIFLFFHHHGSRPYVALSLNIFLLDRLVFRFMLKSRSFPVDLSIAEDNETVLISANWTPPKTLWARLLGIGSIKHGWRSSQHIFISLPSLSRRHFFQAHPFTIASAAPIVKDGKTQHAWFNLIIRAHDGFSRDLLNHAQLRSTALARIDGPYGSTSTLSDLRDADIAVVVAGGSGVAIAFPLLWDLLMNPPSSNDLEAGSSKAVIGRQRVCLVWVVRHASHLSWIGDERLRELDERGLNIIVPEPTDNAGRPDLNGLVTSAVERHEAVLRKWNRGKIRTSVVCSGPDQMNRTVRNACAGLVAEGKDVGIGVENFGW